MSTRTLTVVFTDIKGFTERTSSSSRAALRELLDRHEELLLPVIRHYQGTVVKTIGDAFLLTFESPTNAVLCGLMIQETLTRANANAEESERIRVRVAINTGEVEVRGNDVFGETVNIAARIEGITEAGEVYFTHATYLSMNRTEVPTSEVGERRLKGIDEPIRVYRVIRDENLERYQSLIAAQGLDRRDAAQGNDAMPPARPRGGRRGLIMIAILLALALVAGVFAPGWYARFEAHRSLDAITQRIDAASTREQEDAAFKQLNDLADANQEDIRLLSRVARVNGAHPYWRRFAFEQIRLLVEHDPGLAQDEELAGIMLESLGYLDPGKSDPMDRDVQLRQFMTTTYATGWKEDLLPWVHQPGAGERIDRRNAFLILERSPISAQLDRFRYFTLELWADVRSDDPWNARVFEFLETYLEEHGGPPEQMTLPATTLPAYLTYFNAESDRVVRIVQGLYAEPLRAAIEADVVGEATGPRLHGWKILVGRGWTTPALERAHHRANLEDYWAGYTAGWVMSALRYFANQDPATVGDAVRSRIRTIASETGEIIEGGELPDARQDMDDYRARLRAANDALARLGEEAPEPAASR